MLSEFFMLKYLISLFHPNISEIEGLIIHKLLILITLVAGGTSIGSTFADVDGSWGKFGDDVDASPEFSGMLLVVATFLNRPKK